MLSAKGTAGHRFRWGRIVRCLTRDHRGNALIEFAMVLPMMMLLITGMFGFGWLLNNYITLTDAVGDGARAIALARGQTSPALAASNPCAYGVDTAETAASTLTTANITFKVVYTASGASSGTTYAGSCAGLTLANGDSVQMTATYPVTVSIFGWSPEVFNLVAQTSEQVQ